ncbi:DUF5694 domain-containing protein [Flavobacterium microcysteis]|uniref:TraB/GumN family protein n=1 Tax=Flavobacterium microcysteis TaxID=2596891 RepID=A0A501QG75_9FLAO|nr:DUF5694 domain-containing protein [Flavobacterium microcysteis]TPD71225.1 hypothetical protein FJA49_04825 [Flavobacterium microcysteis]
MKRFFAFLLLLSFSTGFSQKIAKTNVLLIGTYHFNNPGFDQGKMKERNILDKENQEALEQITAKIIKKYNPSKVFVEYSFSEGKRLNELYSLYKNDKPFYQLDTIKKDFYKRFYSENEMFQFGFRLAKKSGNDSIYAIDYDEVPIRFDLIQSKLAESKTFNFSDYEAKIAELSDYTNSCLDSKKLEEVLLCLNSPKQYELNKGLYISFLNRISQSPDFFGPDLVAAWYKRNLIMYANIQNQVSETDKNIVIIVGAGHAAMMEDFIKNDERFRLIRIDQVL